jgi:PKD repeat protein
MSWTPHEPLAGDTVTFDGTSSYDDGSWGGGWIVGWRWAFGDGSEGTGAQVIHVYENPGTYRILLNVTNNIGQAGVDWADITVHPRPSQTSLVSYEHGSGFRIPVPATWDLREDEEFEGTVFELVVSERSPGPSGVLTNVLVDTDRDPTVRETTAYFDEQFDLAIEEFRRDSPNVVVREGPTHLRVANHSAMSFTIGHSGEAIVQTLVVVVSDPHDRYWLLILTTSESELGFYSPMFDDMVAGFEITLAPPTFNSALMAVSVGGVLAAVVGVMAVALFASRSRKARAAARLVTSPLATTRLCAACGTPATSANDRFCMRCGQPFAARVCAVCSRPATSGTDQFCIRCGTPFPGSPAPASPVPAAPIAPPSPPESGPGTGGQVPP